MLEQALVEALDPSKLLILTPGPRVAVLPLPPFISVLKPLSSGSGPCIRSGLREVAQRRGQALHPLLPPQVLHLRRPPVLGVFASVAR